MMKHSIRYTCATVLAAGTLAASPALAGDKSASPTPEQMAEMMKKAEEVGKPGAAHKVLEPLVGNWTAEVKCWMAPGEAPTVSTGKAKATWVMNGRFVREEFTGEFMGKPFHGMSLTGYDNMKKQYTSVWVDDMSTSMVTAAGEARKDGKVLTFEGKYDCPATGQKDLTMKQVVRIVGPNTRIFEMYDVNKGGESKTMEITYRATQGEIAETGKR